jgi:hypothetical protein
MRENMIFKELNGHTPEFGEDCYLAENAVVILAYARRSDRAHMGCW